MTPFAIILLLAAGVCLVAGIIGRFGPPELRPLVVVLIGIAFLQSMAIQFALYSVLNYSAKSVCDSVKQTFAYERDSQSQSMWDMITLHLQGNRQIICSSPSGYSEIDFPFD